MTDENLRSHFLRGINIVDAFSVAGVEIRISTPQASKHLLLTGPNGAGKSTVLQALRDDLLAPGQHGQHLTDARKHRKLYGEQLGITANDAPNRRGLVQALKNFDSNISVLTSKGHVEAEFGDSPPEVPFVLHIPANRTLRLSKPSGPKALTPAVFQRGAVQVSETLQYIVNLKSASALAKDAGDLEDAAVLSGRLEAFERALRIFFGDDATSLVFDRHQFEFTIRTATRDNSFHHLPDGLASAVYIWGGLVLAAEGQRIQGEPHARGWALVDEPELHLHAELQERLLPFLSESFPNVQFIIATHSPAVLASLPGSTVFDLRTQDAYPSEELRGIRYGTILTEHFGISSDFDLDTTRKLMRLRTLLGGAETTEAATAELNTLLKDLENVPHLLVAQAQDKAEFG